ncbi:MAG: tRNA pseudouridine(55) synthase TruB [Desulfobulbales bacterium]
MMTIETDNTSDILPKKGDYDLNRRDVVSFREGVFPVCKPEGTSSFKIVQQLRRILGIKKVGHTGTLDPFASGVLVICAGRSATKLIPQLMEGDKEYVATLQLGITTETQDPEGRIVAERPVPELTEMDIRRCLNLFKGEQMQAPPAYSALKHKGKPLYYYARRGIKIEKPPRLINIKELECLELDRGSVILRIVCSKGTYIRTLAADIGEFLECGAHLRKLQRSRNGFFTLDQTLDGKKLLTDAGDMNILNKYRIPVETIKERLAENRENN